MANFWSLHDFVYDYRAQPFTSGSDLPGDLPGAASPDPKKNLWIL